MGITHVVFGDILFDEHREWAERLSRGRGLTAVEPLWKESTTDLYREFLASGTRARIVTVRASKLDESFLGRDLAEDLLDEFVARDVDPCGERGEYHTVVTSCEASPARCACARWDAPPTADASPKIWCSMSEPGLAAERVSFAYAGRSARARAT